MSDSDSSLDSVTPDNEAIDWQIYLNSADAAPKEAFNQPPSVPQNPFRKGHLLLAIDPKVPGCNVLARVEKTHKCWVRIRFLEFERFTAWKICDSNEIKPFDEQNLHRHPDNPKSHTWFYKWMAKTMDGQTANIAPEGLFQPLKAQWKPKKNIFATGMIVAVFDAHFTGKLSPATVVAVNGDNIRLQIAGRPQSPLSEICLPYHDRSLFPIDFLHKNYSVPSSSGTPLETKSEVPTPTSAVSPMTDTAARGKTRLSAGTENLRLMGAVHMDLNDIPLPAVARRSLPVETSSGKVASREITPIEESLDDGGQEEEDEEEETMEAETQRNETVKVLPSDEGGSQRTEGEAAGPSFVNALPTEYSPFNIGILTTYQCLGWSAARQEELLKRVQGRLAAATQPRQDANRFMGINFPNRAPLLEEDTCNVHFEPSANVGPFLDPEKVRQMPLHFTRTHYVQQVQKVAQFLVYCGKNQQTVADAISNDDEGAQQFLEIFIRNHEQLKVFRIPKPATFNRARYYIHNFLHHLNADRNLIDLVKNEQASSSRAQQNI